MTFLLKSDLTKFRFKESIPDCKSVRVWVKTMEKTAWDLEDSLFILVEATVLLLLPSSIKSWVHKSNNLTDFSMKNLWVKFNYVSYSQLFKLPGKKGQRFACTYSAVSNSWTCRPRFTYKSDFFENVDEKKSKMTTMPRLM